MSGTSKQRIYYWDACIYLAWLLDDPAYASRLPAIAQVVNENADKKNTIITSTIIFTEVWPSTIGVEKERLFRKSFRSQNHITYDVDPPIAMKAREFREGVQNEGMKLTTPDAIHLATASLYKADEVWTFDHKVLRLNQNPKAGKLLICEPSVQEPSLF